MVESLERNPSHALRLVAELKLKSLPDFKRKSPQKVRKVDHFKERIKWLRIVRDACEPIGLTNQELDSAVLTLTRHCVLPPDGEGLVESFRAIKEALVTIGTLKAESEHSYWYLWKSSPRRTGGFVTVRIEVPE